MTLTKNQREADSIRRCLTTKWWTRSAASRLIETWNTRWTTSWTPAKIVREELRRLKPEKTTGVLRNVLILFWPGSYFQRSADQESYLRNENFSLLPVKACKEWQQWYAVVLWNVTQSLPFGFLLSLICSPVWILHISNIWEHHVKVRTTNTHNIVLYAKIWLPGRKKFWIFKTFLISALPFDNVHLAGVDSLNLPFPC